MCETCGCGSGETTLANLATGHKVDMHAHEDHAGAHGHLHEHVHADGTRHWHSHGDEHEQGHAHDHEHSHEYGSDHDLTHDHVHETLRTQIATIEMNARILEKNDRLAERNRAWLSGREILALNLMSAPGAGKTTLLERTIAHLRDNREIFVLEGDQATDHDGARVTAAGAAALQINTGRGCHLDAEMVGRGLSELKPAAGSLLFIENVGNLVCPALFDLGESKRVAILSVTEGDDKPLKYPHMFQAADLMILNKVDLLPHVDFDSARAIGFARQANPRVEILTLSARTGEGMDAWFAWIETAAQSALASAL
jgi:hydrogenase nickel incorporation protein HypB